MQLDDVTAGAWKWVDTAGLRQIQRNTALDPMTLIKSAYAKCGRRTVAA